MDVPEVMPGSAVTVMPHSYDEGTPNLLKRSEKPMYIELAFVMRARHRAVCCVGLREHELLYYALGVQTRLDSGFENRLRTLIAIAHCNNL